MVHRELKSAPTDKVCLLFYPKGTDPISEEELNRYASFSTQALVYPRPLRAIPVAANVDLTPMLNFKSVAGSAIFVSSPELASAFGARELVPHLAVWKAPAPTAP